MRLRLTEKFLWDIFKLIKIKDEIMDEVWSRKYYGFKHPLAFFWPDFFEYRDAYWEQHKEKKKRERFGRMVTYLKNQGYLNIKDLKNRKAIMITPKGMEKVFNTKIKLTEKKRRKDKKWQMVIFDIPEVRKKDREYFRKQLKYLGYKMVQQSIWACPYDVSEDTEILIKRYKLGRFIRLLLVEGVKI